MLLQLCWQLWWSEMSGQHTGEGGRPKQGFVGQSHLQKQLFQQ